MRLVTIGFALVFGLSIGGLKPAEAEPAKRFGRLSDGRAFRIDAQGMRLVDQMAELEVTVDELRRQVIALENELESKKRQIRQLKSGGASSAEVEVVKEENLLKEASSKTKVDCSPRIRLLQARLSELENRLNESQSRAGQAERALSEQSRQAAACDYQSRENPLWAQVERLQEELMKGPSREELARVSKQHESLREQLSEREKELAERDATIASLNRELSEEQAKVVQLDAAWRKASAEQARAQATSSAASAAAEKAEVLRRPESPVAQKLQNRFASELKTIDGLIRERKVLLDRVRANGRSFQVRPLVTSNGLTLDRLRSEVVNLDWSSNSATVQDGLQEIVALLKKDIAGLQGL